MDDSEGLSVVLAVVDSLAEDPRPESAFPSARPECCGCAPEGIASCTRSTTPRGRCRSCTSVDAPDPPPAAPLRPAAGSSGSSSTAAGTFPCRAGTRWCNAGTIMTRGAVRGTNCARPTGRGHAGRGDLRLPRRGRPDAARALPEGAGQAAAAHVRAHARPGQLRAAPGADQLFAAIAASPEQTQDFFGVLTGTRLTGHLLRARQPPPPHRLAGPPRHDTPPLSADSRRPISPSHHPGPSTSADRPKHRPGEGHRRRPLFPTTHWPGHR